MPFSKCSNLEAKNVIHFKLCHQRDKRLNYNLKKTKFRKQTFLDGFYASENSFLDGFYASENSEAENIFSKPRLWSLSILFRTCFSTS